MIGQKVRFDLLYICLSLIFSHLPFSYSQIPKSTYPFTVYERQLPVPSQITGIWTPLTDTPPSNYSLEPVLLLAYDPDPLPTNLSDFNQENLYNWMSRRNALSVIGTYPTDNAENNGNQRYLSTGRGLLPTNMTYSTYDQCTLLFSCMYYVLTSYYSSTFELAREAGTPIPDCIAARSNTSLNCVITLLENGYTDWTAESRSQCPTGLFTVTQDDWNDVDTDANIAEFIASGMDHGDIWWQGPTLVTGNHSSGGYSIPTETTWWPNQTQQFTVALGRQMLGDLSYQCSLASPCEPNFQCQSVGSRTALELGQSILPEAWAYYALTAVKNINRQLTNQWIAIKGSGLEAALSTFKVGDFYPDPNKHFGILNALQGLATAFGILGGFVPGPALGIGSAVVGGVGAYLGRYITPADAEDIKQETFASTVLQIYMQFVNGLDSIADVLFSGEKVNGQFNITDMMKGGAWVNVDVLESVSNTEDQFRIEIISRSIDALWKSKPSNKTFVVFVETDDCDNDKTGPAPLKWCGDGGVYYAYNFIEGGQGNGYISWPWGAQKLQQQFQIDPAVF